MTNARALEIIERYDRTMNAAESRVIERTNKALDDAYRRLEEEFLKAYKKHSGNLDLLPQQRRLLIMDEISQYFGLSNRAQNRLREDFEELIEGAFTDGQSLASDLAGAIANESISQFASVPVDAVAAQARDGVRRLSRHSEDFQNKASAIIELNLSLGSGTQKVARELRRELGITKGKAEQIARTESMSSLATASKKAYADSGIELVQVTATLDSRVCPFCASRNMKVYRAEELIFPFHPSDRCVLMPFKLEWLESGLIDVDFSKNFRKKTIAKLAESGQKPNNGITPFERAANKTKPPESIWTP